jgi:hypothetical protein
MPGCERLPISQTLVVAMHEAPVTIATRLTGAIPGRGTAATPQSNPSPEYPFVATRSLRAMPTFASAASA